MKIRRRKKTENLNVFQKSDLLYPKPAQLPLHRHLPRHRHPSQDGHPLENGAEGKTSRAKRVEKNATGAPTLCVQVSCAREDLYPTYPASFATSQNRKVSNILM